LGVVYWLLFLVNFFNFFFLNFCIQDSLRLFFLWR
jgi:hypothetical protein